MAADRERDYLTNRPAARTGIVVVGDPLPDGRQATAHPGRDGNRWATATPEGVAERAVRLADGCRHVRLAIPGADPVYLGPFANPAVARERAEAVRAFVAALLRTAGQR